jgi:hypothetical protein
MNKTYNDYGTFYMIMSYNLIGTPDLVLNPHRYNSSLRDNLLNKLLFRLFKRSYNTIFIYQVLACFNTGLG